MRKVINYIGLGLMSAAAAAMIAGDAFAGEPSSPFQPTAEKFYLNFDMLAPAALSCDATGPGVRTLATRDLAGKPVLRVTGNAVGAQISCTLPDGTRFSMDANRDPRLYNTMYPTYATVTFQRGAERMTTVLRQNDRIRDVRHGSFLRVVQGSGADGWDSALASLGGKTAGGAKAAPVLIGD